VAAVAGRPANGLVTIGVSTVIAGIAGYAVTLLVYRVVGASSYSVFAVFWAAMYLVIGGLSGIQQEITRATRAVVAGESRPPRRARNFGIVVGCSIAALIVVSAFAWNRAVFPSVGWPLVLPLAIGAGSSVGVAVLAGSLYGLSNWRPVAALVSLDALLRLVLVGCVLIFSRDVVLLAWVVAAPFPVVLLVVWAGIRGRFAGTSTIDSPYRTLAWNAARAVVASVSTAVLVSGFPVLLGLVGRGQSAALLGELIFTITLTRAPLIVSVMSLQSYFVVRFRDRPDTWPSLLWRVLVVIAGCAVVVALLGWWLGRPVLHIVSGHPVPISGAIIAVLVISSALVGMLCVTGPAVLARSLHFPYSLGWALAAVATIGVLILPIDFLPRVILALLVGPIAGLLVHGITLLLVRRSSRREASA
jgi:hypothetical protein